MEQYVEDFNLDFAVKAVETSDDALYIEGRATTFDSDPDRQGETIDRRAFDEAMKHYMSANPVLCLNHNQSQVIGTVVDYRIDDVGVWVKARVSKGAGNVYQLIKDGAYRTFSWFGTVLRAKGVGSVRSRIIKVLDLQEISVVGVPAKRTATFALAAKGADFQLLTGSIATGEGVGAKAGRVLAGRNERRLRAILAEVEAMLAEVIDNKNDEGKDDN